MCVCLINFACFSSHSHILFLLELSATILTLMTSSTPALSSKLVELLAAFSSQHIGLSLSLSRAVRHTERERESEREKIALSHTLTHSLTYPLAIPYVFSKFSFKIALSPQIPKSNLPFSPPLSLRVLLLLSDVRHNHTHQRRTSHVRRSRDGKHVDHTPHLLWSEGAPLPEQIRIFQKRQSFRVCEILQYLFLVSVFGVRGRLPQRAYCEGFGGSRKASF